MKLTTNGVLPRLGAITLSALLCVACNSEQEAEQDLDAESTVESDLPEDIELSQADVPEDMTLLQANSEGSCQLDIPGASVDVSSLDAGSSMLAEFGGLCEISNRILANAADSRRSFVENNDCTFAEESDAAAPQPLVAQGPSILGKLLEPAREDDAEVEKRQLAKAICEDESIMDWAVEEYLKSADLTAFSMGTVTSDNETCPVVLWSLVDDVQGQVFNLASAENCVDIALPHAQLFNPEENPDGQLTGDYIRQVVGYDGDLPDDYDFKGTRYPFVSDEPAVLQAQSAPERQGADRSLLGDDAERYIYWATGEENVDNEYFTADEALTREYHVRELMEKVPRERALTALQRSYGAPVIAWLKPGSGVGNPGVHVAVDTSSGEQFVMIVEPVADVSEMELIDWLAHTTPELLVLQEMDAESRDYLTLAGALFTDGDITVRGELKSCECSTQGFLGWLGKDQLALNEITEKLRKDFIARERNSFKARDWMVSSELGPRIVAYSLSSSTRSSQGSDAAFVVHDGGAANSLVVATDSLCGDQSLAFSFGSNMMNLPASCKLVEDRGVVYTLREESSELANAMRRGSNVIVAVTERTSRVIQKEYPFSLIGASRAMSSLADDEAGYSDTVMKRYSSPKLSTTTQHSLFDLLEKRSVPCSEDSNSPECVAENKAPKIAAAKPVAPRRRSLVIDPDPEDFTPGYAQVIARQLGAGKQPECMAVVKQITQVANSSGTPNTRARKIDRIVGGAPNSCFGNF
ncbi:MAG: hypothetical protein AB8B97_10330 [Granulosicoccus sp.]